jgi:hypothetical protein
MIISLKNEIKMHLFPALPVFCWGLHSSQSHAQIDANLETYSRGVVIILADKVPQDRLVIYVFRLLERHSKHSRHGGSAVRRPRYLTKRRQRLLQEMNERSSVVWNQQLNHFRWNHLRWNRDANVAVFKLSSDNATNQVFGYCCVVAIA